MPYRLAIAQKGGYWDLNPGPSEPQSDALANCAIPTIYEIRQAQSQTCSKGFEPPTHGLEGRCSIQLSYEHIPQSNFVKQAIPPAQAGDGNRTHVSSLEGWCSTIELHPHKLKIVFIIGVTGFEPATSWSQTSALAKLSHTPLSNFHFLFLTTTNFIIHNNIAIVNTYFKYFLDFISISFLIKIMQGKFCLAGAIKLHNYV